MEDKRQDYYFKKAKEEHYPARSVYKLKEINERYRLVKKGDFVLDLGCAPGSWMLYLSERVGDKGKVIGLDLEEPKIDLKKNMQFIKRDIKEALGFFKEDFDVIVSDAAPNTSGIHSVDAAKSLELVKFSFEIVENRLKENGNFVCKIFASQAAEDFIKEIKTNFSFVKSFRPQAVRKHSREFYLIAKGFKKC